MSNQNNNEAEQQQDLALASIAESFAVAEEVLDNAIPQEVREASSQRSNYHSPDDNTPSHHSNATSYVDDMDSYARRKFTIFNPHQGPLTQETKKNLIDILG